VIYIVELVALEVSDSWIAGKIVEKGSEI